MSSDRTKSRGYSYMPNDTSTNDRQYDITARRRLERGEIPDDDDINKQLCIIMMQQPT